MDEKKQISIKTSAGDKSYILHKFSAFDGRYIALRYVSKENGLTEEEHKSNELALLKCMNYVSVDISGREQRLTSQVLVDNYVPDFRSLIELERQVIEFNTSFFQ